MASSVTLRSAGRGEVFVGSSGAWNFEFDPASGAGPRSIDLLLFSLGTCTIAVVSHYMQRKGYATDKLEVDLSSDFDAASKRYGAITVNLRLGDDLTEAQKRSIRAAAGSCRIHNTLKNFAGINIEVEGLRHAPA